ncbi:hypothetical protein P7M21_25695, partial [Vibrio parahaemolyticus]|nr:hypothetical protein [Vibrio parahaemolyticus]
IYLPNNGSTKSHSVQPNGSGGISLSSRPLSIQVPHLYAPAQTGMALGLCPLQETPQNRVQSRPLQLL